MLPKYVKRVRSKGKDYFYFDTGKRVDGKRVYTPLPNLRSPEFGGSYAALLGHRNRRPPAELMRLPALINLYERSAAWDALAPASKKLYAIYLRRFEAMMPTAPVAEITHVDMQKLFDNLGATPSAANAFIAVCRALFAWAKPRGYLTINPADEVIKNRGGEHQPWPQEVLDAALSTDDDIVRLLVHLLFYTGQRLGDVLAMAWTDIRDGSVRVRQSKTKKLLSIRLHEALANELASRARDTILICVDGNGRQLLDDRARKALQEFGAGLGAKIVPHGLRKNAVLTLLSGGCSIAETAAVTGQSLQMVEHYAKQLNQAALAETAILRWQGTKK